MNRVQAPPENNGVDDSVRSLLRRAAHLLDGDSAQLDAELLLGAVLERPRSWLYAHADDRVDAQACASLHALLARRRSGEPVAYLLGRQEFWSLDLQVSRATLIPRPETELLVELALALDLGDREEVLDLGTGSGAIALALAREQPRWSVLGTDRDREALDVARANAARLHIANVAFAASDWYSALAARSFSLIVANPPYIRDGDPCLAGLRFEPRYALAAGIEGLDALRTVIAGAPRHLAPGGWLLCEHGAGQGDAVRACFLRAGFEAVETHRDLGAWERVTRGRTGDARRDQ